MGAWIQRKSTKGTETPIHEASASSSSENTSDRMVKTSTDHAMLQRGETVSENIRRSMPESVPAKTAGEQIQEQSTICRMELDDDLGYGAEITGVKKSAKSQPFQFMGVAREIPNQGWQGKNGNLGIINAIEEEERICNLRKDSREDDHGSSLLVTDMATETNSIKQQEFPKRMWPLNHLTQTSERNPVKSGEGSTDLHK
ncbi:hypothetical protein U1Q18_047015 [Sarracenia purpurea var. burkii]